MPLIEANMYGVPVVASDIPVFREVAGNAALLLERQSDLWANEINKIVSDKARLEDFHQKGLVRDRNNAVGIVR